MQLSGDTLMGMMMIMKKNNDKLTDDQKAKNKEIRAAAMAEKDKTKEEISKIFAEADANGDGCLDRAEFTVFMNKFQAKF